MKILEIALLLLIGFAAGYSFEHFRIKTVGKIRRYGSDDYGNPYLYLDLDERPDTWWNSDRVIMTIDHENANLTDTVMETKNEKEKLK